MLFRCLYRFHYTFPQRISQTTYYLQNKQYFDQLVDQPITSQQFQELKQQLKSIKENEAKIGIIQIALDNGIMKEKLGEIREIMNQYKQIIESNKSSNQLYQHDLGDYYEKEALLLLRECKMQESFDPFKKGLQQFIDLSHDKNSYIIRRIDQILESMIIVIEDMGSLEQAREHIKQGLQIFENLLGKQSEKYIQYLNKLANTYLQVDNQQAINLHKEALQIIGDMNENNFQLYLKTAIELMITQFNQKFDKNLYETINKGLQEYGNIDSELTVYYHVVMSHLFYETKDYQKQEFHLQEAFKVYQNEKSSLLMNIIAQKSLILKSECKNEFYNVLITELDKEFQDVLELQYYKCKLMYEINKQKGIIEFKKIQTRLYNQKLTQYIVDFTQQLAKDGLKKDAILIIEDYPEYDHLLKAWEQK
ncbi:unnamed protein product [Paramecium pentaurelia]|uniref:Tetratricopeptide repeat protein n=1 Tax=Paramecium pentaurelia TaxID=43138 RepID=A0A8S1SJ12_9CILI|nr:unnamed protein product [Paramecium pentaurelia]